MFEMLNDDDGAFGSGERKRTNKCTDKQDVGNYLILIITFHTRCLCQISKCYVKEFLRNL